MGNNDNVFKQNIIFKLSANDGYAERPIYSSRAVCPGEKSKAIDMIFMLRDNFEISQKDEIEKRRKEIEETKVEMDKRKDFIKAVNKPIKWTRDEKGNIISPFPHKKLR